MNNYFIADDLSGALDAAAAFHRSGRRVRVALAATAWPDAAPDDVVGLTTETRNAAPEVAARTVAQVVGMGRARGAQLRYKKIDSTLRGPVAAELGAVRRAWPEAKVLFAPANPAVGRTVQAGRLLVRGVPVAETEFGRDPVWPVRESELRTLLGTVADEAVVIPDVATAADLAAAVAAMAAAGGPWVPVGSGALAVPVAAHLAAGRAAPRPGPSAPWPGAGRDERAPVLMLGGSAHPGNREQAAVLARQRGVPVVAIAPGAVAATVAAALAAVRAAGAVALLAPAERWPAAEALGAIVAAAAEVLAAGGIRHLFVTGGETAFALARTLGVETFDYRAEIEPGLALATAGTGAELRAWAVKPGGFGDAATWVRAFDALRARAA